MLPDTLNFVTLFLKIYESFFWKYKILSYKFWENPTMCTPAETSYAIEMLSRNNAVYDQCMIQRGYVVQQ